LPPALPNTSPLEFGPIDSYISWKEPFQPSMTSDSGSQWSGIRDPQGDVHAFRMPTAVVVGGGFILVTKTTYGLAWSNG
jgi:hypothetical protein